jgi:hypothetical protein
MRASTVNAYRITMAVIGTLVAIAAAAISVTYFAFLVLPICLAAGGVALWLTSAARSVRFPIAAAAAGALCLAVPTVVYVSNQGNWNQPGTQWLLFPLLFGVLLLGVTPFGVYVRYVARPVTTLAGGPALVVASAVAFWWLLNVDSSRADLYMYRLHAVFVCVYAVIGTILVADRLLPR